MKRKRKDDAGSLDSLLDTITTVVGILIILLIVVQLGADSAVNRIVDERKKENADELMELAMKQFEDQKKTLLEEKKKIQLKLASENKEQAQLIQEISKLEKELAAKKKAMPPSPPKVQNLRQEKTKLDNDKKAIEVKVRKVKGLLSKASRPSQSLSKDLSLPDPKPAPPKAKPFRFLCRDGKIYPLDDQRLVGRVTQELQKAGIKPNKAKEYDGKKIISHFSKAKPGDPFFQAIPRIDGNKRVIFDLRKKPPAGEDEEALAKPGSRYLAALKGITPKTHYLQFEVFEDSFATYLAARELAGKRNFPAGWKPILRGPDTDCTLALWTINDLGRAALLASRPPPKPTGKPPPKKPPSNVLD